MPVNATEETTVTREDAKNFIKVALIGLLSWFLMGVGILIGLVSNLNPVMLTLSVAWVAAVVIGARVSRKRTKVEGAKSDWKLGEVMRNELASTSIEVLIVAAFILGYVPLLMGVSAGVLVTLTFYSNVLLARGQNIDLINHKNLATKLIIEKDE